jgi:hypothetical protein
MSELKITATECKNFPLISFCNLQSLSSLEARTIEIIDIPGRAWTDSILVPSTTKNLSISMQTQQISLFKITPLLGLSSSPILRSLIISQGNFCEPTTILAILEAFPLLQKLHILNESGHLTDVKPFAKLEISSKTI